MKETILGLFCGLLLAASIIGLYTLTDPPQLFKYTCCTSVCFPITGEDFEKETYGVGVYIKHKYYSREVEVKNVKAE